MRAALVVALFVAPALLAGCATPAGSDTGRLLALPHLGDAATYAATGSFIDFLRWNNGFWLSPSGSTPLTLSLAAAGDAVDGTRKNVSAFRVHLASGDTTLHDLFVSPAHASVVQSWSPLDGRQAVLAFDERGYPWAWGASVLHGRPLAPGASYAFSLVPNARERASKSDPQGVALALSFDVAAPERVPFVASATFARPTDAYRVSLAGNASVTWTLWLAPDVPYPLRVEIDWRDAGLAPYVRVDAKASVLHFAADLVSFTRGAGPLPPRDSTASFSNEQVGAAFAEWDGVVPPEGSTVYEPFALSDALAWTALTDRAWQSWSSAHADAHLYRATFSAAAGAVQGGVVYSWLVYYVSSANEYYAFEVNRTEASGAPPAPPPVDTVPVPTGVTQTVSSGPTAAPKGEHGWFASDQLPKKLLTLASGVALVEGTFKQARVEIFLRSFTEPVGYAYYIDGGVGAANAPAGVKPDRFTVIVSAESGFIEAAVGPVRPLVTGTAAG